MWTQFWDMHSGGGCKQSPLEMIYIEAPLNEAKIIFYNRFGHNPDRVTCTCCGPDYSIDAEEDLAQLTAFHRNCAYAYFKDGKRLTRSEAWIPGKGTIESITERYVEELDQDKDSYAKYKPLQDYLSQMDVLAIYYAEIKPEERLGEIPEQGYIWH